MELRERGYGSSRVRARSWLMLELSWWMAQRELSLSELHAGLLEELLAEARADQQGPGKWFSPSSERDVLAYLRELGVVEPADRSADRPVRRVPGG